MYIFNKYNLRCLNIILYVKNLSSLPCSIYAVVQYVQRGLSSTKSWERNKQSRMNERTNGWRRRRRRSYDAAGGMVREKNAGVTSKKKYTYMVLVLNTMTAIVSLWSSLYVQYCTVGDFILPYNRFFLQYSFRKLILSCKHAVQVLFKS